MLCAPTDDDFQDWLGSVASASGPTCASVVFAVSEELDDQVFEQGRAINDFVLPEAIGGVPPFTYVISPDLPIGLVFNAGTRTLSGTPVNLFESARYTYTATDTNSESDSLRFSIEVVAAALTLPDSVADQTYTMGVPIVELVLPEAGGGIPPYTYSLSPLPPAGLSFDVSTRTLAGTPDDVTEAGLYMYEVADAASVTAKLQFTIEVVSSPLSSEDSDEIPDDVTLQGNYPNPFVTTTNILFDLPTPADVSVTVTDIIGRTVMQTNPVHFAAGRGHRLTIDGTTMPAGAYMYHFLARTEYKEFLHNGTLFRVK